MRIQRCKVLHMQNVSEDTETEGFFQRSCYLKRYLEQSKKVEKMYGAEIL